MASITKFTHGAVTNELKHNNRLNDTYSNTDIDPTKTHLNYSLTPYIHVPRNEYHKKEVREKILQAEQARYQQRKSELYCYNRKDIKTLAGCIVTCPAEITTPEEQELFFRECASFLTCRYGKENCISIAVHYDEGRTLKLKDSVGNYLTDANGNPVTEFHLGRPHMHFVWIPACKIDHEKLNYKLRTGKVLPEEIKRDPESGRYYIDRKYKLQDGEKIPTRNVPKAMREKDEKISSNDVINKYELLHLHGDLQDYLREKGIDNANIQSGITQELGGNRTVKELKKDFDQIQTLIEQQEINRVNMTAKIKSLERSNRAYRDNFKLDQEKIYSLEKQVKEYTDSIHTLSQQVEENRSITQSLKTLQTELSHARDQNTALQKEIDNLRVQEKEYETQIKQQNEELKQLRYDIEHQAAKTTTNTWGASHTWGTPEKTRTEEITW